MEMAEMALYKFCIIIINIINIIIIIIIIIVIIIITDTELNNCFSLYHTSWITSSPKSNFILENIGTKAILFFFGCSEVNQ